jgi:tetraacyldisaccharide 4'-kinase
VSTAFRYLVQARNKLYQTGILRTHRLNHPVISVGNLTVGGTGKTPLVIAIAEHLREKGYRPVILSRGYKRQAGGILLAGSSWKESGDEPHLMARRLGDVPVVVGASRYRAGAYAELHNLGNVFILDDGFQHRQLHRDMDIVTIDADEWIAGEHLLPTGRWREPKCAIERAHAACVQERRSAEIHLPIPVFEVQTMIDGLYRNGTRVGVESLFGRRVVAFAGIAKPERFFDSLEDLGIRAERKVCFRDHHAYSADDVAGLRGDVVITTEKDAVRLEGLQAGEFLVLRISVKIPDFDRLWDIILKRIPSHTPGESGRATHAP